MRFGTEIYDVDGVCNVAYARTRVISDLYVSMGYHWRVLVRMVSGRVGGGVVFAIKRQHYINCSRKLCHYR